MTSLQDVFVTICPLPQMRRRFYRNISAAYVMAITLCSYSYKLSLDAHPADEDDQCDGGDDRAAHPTKGRIVLSPSVEHSRPLSVVLVRPVLFHRWRRWSFGRLR